MKRHMLCLVICELRKTDQCLKVSERKTFFLFTSLNIISVRMSSVIKTYRNHTHMYIHIDTYT